MPDSVSSASPPLLVDAHLDVAYNAVVLERDLAQPVAKIREQERRTPSADADAGVSMVSWPALIEGHIAVIGGSIFVEPYRKAHPRRTATYRTPDEAHAQGIAQLDYYRRTSDERDDVQLLENDRDLEDVLQRWETERPTAGVFVVMEGADPILEPGELAWWVERGLRGVALSWSAGTRYAGGNANPGPLTDEGIALIDAMADYNLLLDVSHLWEDAAHKVLDRYPGPLVATHANPRAFVDTPRQLSDDMIRRVAEREGVIGVVAYNRMLDPEWSPGRPRVPLARLIEAIDHMCQVAGTAASTGIGSDLDGGYGQESAPAELESVADLAKIGDLLRERGYGEADIQAILRGNWLRTMRAVLGAF
ncbi:MAG: membrane dipeptidase [Anaerolineae bacterium]|nr:membrane dipeptidase [Anaerolineae bacterium]